MCLSRKRTLTYLDKEGEEHDKEVLKWRAEIENAMMSSKVNNFCLHAYLLHSYPDLKNFSSLMALFNQALVITKLSTSMF